MIDLRFGRYQGVLQDVGPDVLICDPPYSDVTQKGRRTGLEIRQSNINYAPLTKEDAVEIAQFWSGRVKWWAVIFGDHVTRGWHAKAWKAAGWHVFGPVRWVKPNATPRFAGDGPTVSTEDILVARRKIRLPTERTGSRPGHYVVRTETGGDINTITGKSYPGKKPLELMKAIVSDYSLPGDLVCDPFAGTGTTLIAAAQLGRDAIGAEISENVYLQTVLRLESNNHPDYAYSRLNQELFIS